MDEMRTKSEDLLERQILRAEENYRLLKEQKVRAISLIGSIGSGKTSLIEQIIDRAAPCGIVVATIVGAAHGEDDVQRFLARGILSVGIDSHGACHLEPKAINDALHSLPLAEIDLLFIENVGCLRGPADYPLGGETEAVVIAVTEGDAVVRKNPKIFSQTDLVVITKVDLAAAVGVKIERIVNDYSQINPHGKIVLTDTRRRRGIDDLLRALEIECANTQW